MKHEISLKQKLMAITIFSVLVIGSMFGAWALGQEECCNWTEVLLSALVALPIAILIVSVMATVRSHFIKKAE